MHDMTLRVIGNSGSDHDRCTGNKRDQDLFDIECGTGQAKQDNKPYNREDKGSRGYRGEDYDDFATVKPFRYIITFQSKFMLLFY